MSLPSKKPVPGRSSAHLLSKEPVSGLVFIHRLVERPVSGAILGAQHSLYSLKSRFSTPFCYRSAKNGRRTDAQRTVNGRRAAVRKTFARVRLEWVLASRREHGALGNGPLDALRYER